MLRAIRQLALLALLLPLPAGAAGTPGHGEAQVLRMSRERPALGRAIADRPGLRAWLIRELDGRSTGFPIEWDGAEPVTGCPAEHEYPIGPGAAKVRVRANISGLDQLAGLVFELQNVRGFGAFEAAWQAALRGEIGRHEFTARMMACEFEALERTRALLACSIGPVFLLDLDEHPLTAHLLDASPTLEAQIRKYRRLGYDMESHFVGIWDREIEPRRIVAN